MWQMMVAQAAMSGVSSYLVGSANEANVKAENRISRAQAAANNKTRQANNALQASRLSLESFTRTLGNQRIMEAGGEQVEAEVVNSRRNYDALINSSLDQQIQFAEQEGAMTAQAALNGVAGSVVQDVQLSSGIRRARAEADADKVLGLLAWDTARRISSIAQQTFQSLDQGRILPTLDYNVDLANEKVVLSAKNAALLGALGGAGQGFIAGGGALGGGGGGGDTTGSTKVSFGSPRLGENASTPGGWWGSGTPRLGSSSPVQLGE